MRREPVRCSFPALSLFLCAALWLAAPARAQDGGGQEQHRVFQIMRTPQPPRLDVYQRSVSESHSTGSSPSIGSGLTDSLAGSAITEFRQREPGDGTPVSHETAAYVTYDDENLYVVFVCRDDPAKVRANVARREDIGDDDVVAVYLDTFHDRERAYVFMVNPRGIQRDGLLTEGQDEDLSWDAVWRSEGRLTDDGYVVKLAIPFRSLRFSSGSAQTWGIALGRIIQRNNEESYWPHITKRNKSFVPQFAELQGLTNISAGRNIQLTPYAAAARARVLDEDASEFSTLGDERVGLDAKIVMRDAMTLDATMNPDFSQVETDDPQVTVNERFEVFFPEKRPFFIENAGYFQTPVNLFFSRRIVDPGAGLRLTGKLGRWAVGAMAINDRQPGRVAPPDELAGSKTMIAALRLQREVGEESTVGALATDYELEGSFNRVLGLDSRLSLGSNWAFTGQVTRSETRDLEGERLAGYGALAELVRDARHLEYTGRYMEFSPDFVAELGFVQRVGIRETEQELQYTFRPDGRVVAKYGPSVSALYTWDHASGLLLDRELSGQFQVVLLGQTELEFEYQDVFERFEGFEFRPYSSQASLTSEWFKWLGLGVSYEWGTAVNHDPADDVDPFLGRAAETEVSVTLRPTPRLRLSQAYIFSELHTTAGAPVLAERLLRTKINYQFNRFLSIRAVLDYEAETGDPALADIEDEKQWLGDLLLTYLVNPGTALYLGYTDNYENVALVGDPPEVERRESPRTSTGRQLFVKLSYLLRF